MKATKDRAKKEIENYGTLLQERAVITEIKPLDVRGEQHYVFIINDSKYPLEMECSSVIDLARVLTSMWYAYTKARSEFIPELV